MNVTLKTVVDTGLKELKSHGTQEFPMGVYRDDFAFMENHEIPWHWHEEIQFDIVICGNVRFFIGSSEYLIKEGEGIFINRGLLHRIVPETDSNLTSSGTESKADANNYMQKVLLPETTQIYSFVLSERLIETDYASLVYISCIKPVLDMSVEGIILEKAECRLLYETAELCSRQQKGYAIAAKARMCLIFEHLLGRKSLELRQITVKQQRDSERVKQTIVYIKQNYSKDISLEDMAGEIAVSKSELCRGFKRVLKMSPVEYMIKYRVGEAARLLRSTSLNVTDIAQCTGFDSISHLDRFFTRSYGMSPYSYRKKEGLSIVQGNISDVKLT